MRTRLLPLALALGWTSACYQRPELSDSWYLDRLRVLAVRAEPAEPVPGQDVTFESLIWSPDGDPELVIWFACLPESGTDFGCTVDPALLEELSAVDPSTMSPEELAALAATLEDAGLIGAEPYFSPSWTAPVEALDGLTESEQLEGVSALVTLQAVPADAQSDADLEIAYKRMPISLASTPNSNPDLDGLRIDDALYADGSALALAAGQTITLEPALAADAIQDYTYRNEDGADETRTEEPYFTWFASGGDLEDSATLCDESGPSADDTCPDAATTWTAPDETFEGVIYAVVRDRRGGMHWTGLNVTVP